MKRALALLAVACFSIPAFAAPQAPRQNPLDSARELYASARYDEALAMLNGLRPDSDATDRRSIEQYRSLCLLALGRGTEAEEAIAAVVTTDPFFQPGEAEASPRVRSAFTDVRRRLLPEIATARYSAAKGSYDRKEYATAERQFRELLTLLNDPDMGARLGDLRILAAGFLDLSIAAAAPPPEPPKPAKTEPAPVAPPPAPKPEPGRIYGAEDASVAAPTIVRQDVPAVPSTINGQIRDRGRVDVVIDEQGRVNFVALRQPMHPFYDQLLLAAAREWRYRPATMNGVPVKYRKSVSITFAR